MRLSDLSGMFKKSTASFIRLENPMDDYYLVYLKPAKVRLGPPASTQRFACPTRASRDATSEHFHWPPSPKKVISFWEQEPELRPVLLTSSPP